jgi:hypothetical protein
MAEPRAKDRATGVLLRMSVEDKARLRSEAEAQGVSLQVLLERRLLGKPDADNRPPGRVPRAQKEVLLEAKDIPNNGQLRMTG